MNAGAALAQAPTAGGRRPDAPPPAVRVEGLTKSFPVARTWIDAMRNPSGRVFVKSVNDVSFEVARGEFYGLLGPNGAGKTTIFKLLATSITPDAGTATIMGYDLERDPRQVRHALTPVLANERSLNWRLSARENLNMFAALYLVHGREARERVDEVLDVVQLVDVGEKMVGNFSSGMRQRLLIARALLSRPAILLLDEPTRSLDPLSARSFRRFLREEVCGRRGCTVLLATHSAEEALHLCDRVGVLHRGEMLATGTANHLLERFGDERYRIWTQQPAHEALTVRAARGELALVGDPVGEEEGWWRVEIEITGGITAAAELLQALVHEGLSMARYERVTLSLADLIERIVQRGAA